MVAKSRNRTTVQKPSFLIRFPGKCQQKNGFNHGFKVVQRGVLSIRCCPQLLLGEVFGYELCTGRCCLGPPVVPFYLFLGEGSPTTID